VRVLILTSGTGGGHDMRARAFQEWAQLSPELNLETQLHRPLESSHWFYRFGVGLYNWIQRRAPVLHHFYFNFLEVAAPCRSARALLGAAHFRDALETIRPDLLLSVHGSLNHGFFEYARTVLGSGRVRCVTYCGELYGGYGFSRNCVNPTADLFIGAVPETCAAAARWGMAPEKNKVGGFLLRPSFYEAAPDATARRAHIVNEFQLNPDEFILLLSASSRGANNHVQFLSALQRRGLNLQVVVLCGNSAEAHAQVSDWINKNPSGRVRIIPHDTNIAMLLRCVSAVVARPGTGSTSEGIMSECPLLLNCLGGVMPQEWITVKFCRKHGLARTIHRADELAAIVQEWTRNPAEPAAIRQRMHDVRPSSTLRDILSTVANQV
jgi:processive 1,2-diacylglycerol beta-glucosyltransferase